MSRLQDDVCTVKLVRRMKKSLLQGSDGKV